MIADFFHMHKWPLLAAAAVSGLGLFPLMGLPGAGLMTALDAIAGSVHPRTPAPPTQYGDAYWPVALCYSLAVPWVLFGIYLGLKSLGIGGWQNAAMALLAGFVAIAGFHALWIYPPAAARGAQQLAYEASPDARLRDLKQALMRLSDSDSDHFLSNLQLREPGKRTVGSELFDVLEQMKDGAAGPQLSPAQLSSLQELTRQLRSIEGDLSLQREDAIKTSAEWVEVRRRSRSLVSSLSGRDPEIR